MVSKFINTELLLGAVDGLRSHKLRSGLTTLGVIFGVAAVISMSSIGEGARREALQQIEQMGASNIIIDDARPEDGEERRNAIRRNPKGLILADAEALKSVLADVELVVPQRFGPMKVRAGSQEAQLNIVSSTPDIFTLQKNELSEGRFYSWLDEEDLRKICVLGGGAKRELFPLESAIGKDIRVGKVLLTVVGVLERQSTGGELEGFTIRDRNTDVYVPLSTSLIRYPPEGDESVLHRIVVSLSDVSEMRAYGSVIERAIFRRHHEISDFEVIIPEELLKQHQQTQRIFNIVMGTIASISLLVGGIGIMNIMLASVLERTREIGVRRALGARQSDIARQFLAEATLLSLSGGVIGVIFGIILARIISMYANWDTAVSVWSILIAVGVSVGVGIIFGYLPARRAAKLDPITALRFE
ncbi:MAG: FtsX-like permease family protein [Calditrichaeota bacterium]|jgi:putative ABC transport system permease protein|nr:FtsX-like permease family protein [Calditrichota bacterium]MBT7615870.1 FtsX-like permease family protein [Calditrichota bacterium]MBT7787290.1 FtsX-like permease family protein [Calditrichota bacterium]